MEQTTNTPLDLPAPEPPPEPTPNPLILAQESAHLTESMIDAAAASGRTGRPGWSDRADGWTDDRIRAFLAALAQCGVVADACRAVGLSQQSAYAFRTSPRGRAFDVAWRAALLRARGRLSDALMSRALNGYVEVIRRDGEVVAERHRYDNRLSMAVLTRLDALASSSAQEDEAPRLIVHELDAFVDSLCAGPEQAAAFIEARCTLPDRSFDEENIIRRNIAPPDTELPGPTQEGEPTMQDTMPGDPAPCAPPDATLDERRVAAMERLIEAAKAAARRDGWDPDETPDAESPSGRRGPALRRGLRQDGQDAPDDRSDRREREKNARRRAADRQELESMSDEALAGEFEKLVPLLLEITGLEGEIDPDLLRRSPSPATAPAGPEQEQWQDSISSTS